MVAAAVVAVAAAVAVAVATEAAILCVPKRMNVNPGTERETHGTKKRVGQEKLVIAVAHGCTNPRTVMIKSAASGSQHATAALVELGADTSSRDLQGKRPVDLTYERIC